MVIASLYKEQSRANGASGSPGSETRIIHFWIHQKTRLTDGHIVIPASGKPRISVNWSSRGTPSDIAERARYEQTARKQQAGMAEWDKEQVAALLAELGIEHGSGNATKAFADVVLHQVRNAERAAAHKLSIQWDVEEQDISDAIGMRYLAVQKAEAILNDAGLLVDADGTVVNDTQVAATLEVTEFEAAKSLLWTTLSPEERRYNCRIVSA